METTTKSFMIGQAVTWSKDGKNYEGVVRDDFGKEKVEVMCTNVDGRRVCHKKNIERELLIKKVKEMSDVKKILLKGQFKKLTNKQLTTKVESGKLNELELEVANEILNTRGIDKVVESSKRMNNINPMPKTKELKVAEKKKVGRVKNIKKEKVVEKTPVVKVPVVKVPVVKVPVIEVPVIKDSGQPLNKSQKKDIRLIDPRLLKVEPDFNTRFDYGDLDELKQSIIENGVRIPLRGYKQGEYFIVVDGHRRHSAIVMAINEGVEIARVPFISEKKRSLEERIFDVLLSNDGKQLTALELGETYRRLVNCGFNYTEIAKKIGKGATHVTDMVRVAESSKELKGMIKERKVSATLVKDVKNTVKDDEKAEKIIKDKVQEKEKEAEKSGEEVKVTKKDLKNVIEKQPDNSKTTGMVDIDELEEKKKNVAKPVKEFTRQEVIVLLKQQIEACKEVLLEEFRVELDNVELVLKS